MKLNVALPEKLSFLLGIPIRYKAAFGGRGSAKSWSFARALLTRGVSKPTRILCAREVQLSIKQSVHQLLRDQIQLLGISHEYTVLETEIRGRNGTLIVFSGLSTLTVDTIKSYEGFDIVWVEEGQTVSKRSWDILIPTIRKEGSEIWVSFNPDLETDETYQRFIANQPDDCIAVRMNWRDNPWFNEVQNNTRLEFKRRDPDNYDNIWEGKCRPAVEGAIYFKEVQAAEEQRRICRIPYDSMLRVHLVFDLGWDDSLAVGLVQKHLSEIRVIEYIEVSHTTLPDLSAELKTRRYNWGRAWLPHDGFSGSLNAGGKSTFDILTALGWDCATRDEIVELSVEEGIRQTRLSFPRLYFDVDNCHAPVPEKDPNRPASTSAVHFTDLSWRLIECLKRYRRHMNPKTEAAGKPERTPHAHGADTLRYIALNADRMLNVNEVVSIPPGAVASYGARDRELGI